MCERTWLVKKPHYGKFDPLARLKGHERYCIGAGPVQTWIIS